MKINHLARSIVCFIAIYSFNVNAKDIYVTKNGNDSNSGTESAPFLTLSKAATEAVAGDVVNIGTGTYEETLRPVNSGTSGNPIIFQSIEGEKVIITAMQAISGWTLDKGSIYTATVDWDLGQNNFVMQGSTAMDLARWPNNKDGDPFTKETLRNTSGSGPDEANARLNYEPGIPDGDWSNGGSLYFYGGGGWLAWYAFITSNDSNSVSFHLDNRRGWIRTAHAPDTLGDFFLQGILEALDYQNEWYLDASADTIYVQLPEGTEPVDGQVQVRRRIKAIDLSARNFIHVKNLAVFGGGIDLTSGASNNLIYGVTSLYGNHTLGVQNGFLSRSDSIHVAGGSNNKIEKSEIGFGAGSGIRDAATNTEILNSYIHDFNTLGSYDAPIMARGGNGTKLIGNLLTRGGRDVVQSVNKNLVMSYNDLSYSNLIADDCGLFYTTGGAGDEANRKNAVISHNWFHDTSSIGTKSGKEKFKAAGIYLDNDAGGYDVHHNVVWNTEWSAVQINWSGTDLEIHNNTMWNNERGTYAAWHKEGTAFSNVNMWNNLVQKAFTNDPQVDFQTNIVTTDSPFVDVDNGDFRLRPGTEPVSAGQAINGITDDVTDGAPDVGAYEINGNNENWKPGIDWDRKAGPTGYGCYGLPGEDCIQPGTEPPIITLSEDLRVNEGDTVEISIELSNLALSYPVIIPYTIAGTANSSDHDGVSGTLSIESGVMGSVAITITDDEIAEGDETIVITLGTPTNAVLEDRSEASFTIAGQIPAGGSDPETENTGSSEGSASSGGGGSSHIWLLFLLGILIPYRLTRLNF